MTQKICGALFSLWSLQRKCVNLSESFFLIFIELVVYGSNHSDNNHDNNSNNNFNNSSSNNDIDNKTM